MASKEIAAMLDELMGRNRNAGPDEKLPDLTWEDTTVCRYYLVNFCPHDLFTNTKADLGACPNIHDDDMKAAYMSAPDSSYKKQNCKDDFLRFCQKMLNDLGNKIKRAKERLLLTQMEQAAANGITPQQQEEIEEKIKILTDKINVLVDQAEQAGIQGDVEEAQGLLKLCDQLKTERDDLKQQIGLKATLNPDGQFGPPKAMEVCETCGAFLIVGDAQQRIDDHLMGKLHVGYARMRATVEQMSEEKRRQREQRELQKEREAEERRMRRDQENMNDNIRAERLARARNDSGEGDGEEKKEDDEGRSKDRERRRSRSRDRRRSRSRDRRDRDRHYRRDRSRDRYYNRDRRDRSRDRHRDRRHRSRSR